MVYGEPVTRQSPVLIQRPADRKIRVKVERVGGGRQNGRLLAVFDGLKGDIADVHPRVLNRKRDSSLTEIRQETASGLTGV